jgi:hypothetical protein
MTSLAAAMTDPMKVDLRRFLQDGKESSDAQAFLGQQSASFESLLPSSTLKAADLELPFGLPPFGRSVSEASTQASTTPPTPQAPEQIEQPQKVDLFGALASGLPPQQKKKVSKPPGKFLPGADSPSGQAAPPMPMAASLMAAMLAPPGKLNGGAPKIPNCSELPSPGFAKSNVSPPRAEGKDSVPKPPAVPEGGFPGTSTQKRKKTRKHQNFSVYPSRGSKNHELRQCRPCKDFNSPKGCTEGVMCNFCHFQHDDDQVLEAQLFSAKANERKAQSLANTEPEEAPDLAWDMPMYVSPASFANVPYARKKSQTGGQLNVIHASI